MTIRDFTLGRSFRPVTHKFWNKNCAPFRKETRYLKETDGSSMYDVLSVSQ